MIRRHLLQAIRQIFIVSTALVTGIAVPAAAQTTPVPSHDHTGEELYRAGGCASCHGVHGAEHREPNAADAPDGGSRVEAIDFTRCSFTSSEPDEDWLAVIHDGGRARAFSPAMPAFRDRFSDDEIETLVRYLRTFCASTAWPRGNLNLPRALFTEQAYPENAALVTTTIDHGADAAVGTSLVYEHRLRSRQQIEVRVPLNVRKFDGTWEHGLGDLTLAFKQVVHHDVDRGRILSAGGEVVLPTGADEHGLGRGATVIEPFVVYGQILPAHSFVQVHGALELPTDAARAPREAFVRAAAGHRMPQGRWGRVWTPMLELLGARELDGERATFWDLVPELQLTLSRRQHVTINGGLRVPLSHRDERKSEVAFYLLWDWYHGGLFEGWR